MLYKIVGGRSLRTFRRQTMPAMPPFPLVQITTSNLTPPPVESYRDLVARALAEDVGSGDITTRAVVLSTSTARAELVAKSRVVVAGLDVAREVWRQLD